MMYQFALLTALAMTATGALAQEQDNEAPTEGASLDALIDDLGAPADADPEADAKPEAESEDSQTKANWASLDTLPYMVKSAFSSLYSGATLVRAERHGGHYDLWFTAVDGKSMVAEVRPDGTLGEVKEAD